MTQEPMHAWMVEQYGPFQDVLQWTTVPRPTPDAGCCLIRVKAAGVNFPDILAIAGKYQVRVPLPFTPGTEFSGEIVAVGEGSRFKPGDRVMGFQFNGAFAEYIVAPEQVLFPVPNNMPHNEAAGFLVTYQTAHFALTRRTRLDHGEILLVHGGAGGVGTAAIQLGKSFGATVIATAGGSKTEVCKHAGADHVIDYKAEDLVARVREITDGHGADVILDPVGGDVFDASTRCLAWEGRLVVVGFTSGRIPDIAANRILLKNISVIGLNWPNYQLHQPELIVEAQNQLYDLYTKGDIKPVINRIELLENLPQALEAIQRRESYGKIILQG